MFQVVTVEEVVQVPPRLFGLPRFKAMEHVVNRKYSNKVLSGVGVCIALWDWVSAEDHRLVPQSGDANTCCSFRLLVFVPVTGETMWGRIHSVSEEGISIDLDFMGGIFVAKKDLPEHSIYDAAEKAWRLKFDDEPGGEDRAEEGEEKEEMPSRAAMDEQRRNGVFGEEAQDDVSAEAGKVECILDVGNSVAFTIVSAGFTDGVDHPPDDPKKVGRANQILTVRASMKAAGLGRYEWWAGGDEEEAADSNGKDGADEGGEEFYGEGDDDYDEYEDGCDEVNGRDGKIEDIAGLDEAKSEPMVATQPE